MHWRANAAGPEVCECLVHESVGVEAAGVNFSQRLDGSGHESRIRPSSGIHGVLDARQAQHAAPLVSANTQRRSSLMEQLPGGRCRTRVSQTNTWRPRDHE